MSAAWAEKEAASALRRRISLAATADDGFNLLLNGERIGSAALHSAPTGELLPEIRRIGIDKDMRGLGLGKKFYGELTRRMPNQTLHSDAPHRVSDDARRVWEGAASRGYNVKSEGGRFSAQLPAAAALPSEVKVGSSEMRELMHTVEHDELEGNDLSITEKIGGQEYLRAAFEELFGVPQLDVVALTLMQKSASVADLELYKAAEFACPSDPIQLYEELGGGYKLASPAEARFDQAYDEAARVGRPITIGTLGGMGVGAGAGLLLARHLGPKVPGLPNPHTGGALLGGLLLGGAVGNRIGHSLTDQDAYAKASKRVDAADDALEHEKKAGRFDRAKGLSRVGELLSGSRAGTLGKAKEEATTEAGKHMLNAMKHDPSKVTPKILGAVKSKNLGSLSDTERQVVEHAGSAHKANVHSRRADRLGKVLKAEDHKVLKARVGAGVAGTAAVAGGVAAASKKSDSK